MAARRKSDRRRDDLCAGRRMNSVSQSPGVVSGADHNFKRIKAAYRGMKHLTKRHYGHHIGKGCGLGITVPESGSGHGFKEPQRGVWHRRKWTTEDVGVEQRCEYLRPLPYDILELFFALEYIGFTLSEIHKMLLPDPCRRVPTRCAARAARVRGWPSRCYLSQNR